MYRGVPLAPCIPFGHPTRIINICTPTEILPHKHLVYPYTFHVKRNKYTTKKPLSAYYGMKYRRFKG